MYATSVENPNEKDKKSKKARELYQYLNSDKEGLLPCQKRGISIPEPEKEKAANVYLTQTMRKYILQTRNAYAIMLTGKKI